MYGRPEYNDKGQIKCEICGEYFERVSCHVLKAHKIHAIDYKRKHGFVLAKGLCSEQSRLKTSKQSKERVSKGQLKTFLQAGTKTQYKKGDIGRPRNLMSEEAKINQTERLYPYRFKPCITTAAAQ